MLPAFAATTFVLWPTAAAADPTRVQYSETHEFAVHPDEIKQLQTGWAVIACPGRTQPRITRMLHPEDAR